jgi:hypothetical protein
MILPEGLRVKRLDLLETKCQGMRRSHRQQEKRDRIRSAE